MSNATCFEFLKNPQTFLANSLFYLYGEEPFLIEESVKKLAKELLGKMNDFNTAKFYADAAEPKDIIEVCETMPFGTAKRLVLVRRADAFSAKDLESFLPYLENPAQHTTLVFCGGDKVDARTKFFKDFKKLGVLLESPALKSEDVRKWIRVLAKRRGHEIEERAVEVIEMLCGTSLHVLEQTLERLSLFVGQGKRIEQDLIRELLFDTREGILWSLTDALGQKNRLEAFVALKRILRQKEISSPVLVTGTLYHFYRRLLAIRLAKSINLPEAELTQTLHLSPGALYFNRGVAQRFTTEELEQHLASVFSADRNLKSTGLSPRLILERALLEFTTPKSGN